MNRRRILLVSYQCGPGMGSVSQIGWEWYARLCQTHEVTLVTHSRNRAALASVGAPLSGGEILEVDTEWFAGPLYRLARWIFPRSEHCVFIMSSLDYFIFDRAAYRALRQRLSDGQRWDLLQRVTPVTLAAPTWLGRLGIPTIIGPLNCGLGDPPGFDAILRQESTWFVKVRGLGRCFDSLIGSSHHAGRILAATSATLRSIASKYQKKCIPMLENGVDTDQFTATDWPTLKDGVSILFVGRLIPAKALTRLLDALAELKRQGILMGLEVIGDGPLRNEWEAYSQSLGLSDTVHFRGGQPALAVAEAMRRAHVFCLPSVRESGGAVLLEAMASARPVIAMDFGGPSEIIDSEVGHLVTMASPPAAIAGLVACLRDVIENPLAWQARGLAGRERVEKLYSWGAKINQANRLYDEVIEERK